MDNDAALFQLTPWRTGVDNKLCSHFVSVWVDSELKWSECSFVSSVLANGSTAFRWKLCCHWLKHLWQCHNVRPYEAYPVCRRIYHMNSVKPISVKCSPSHFHCWKPVFSLFNASWQIHPMVTPLPMHWSYHSLALSHELWSRLSPPSRGNLICCMKHSSPLDNYINPSSIIHAWWSMGRMHWGFNPLV